MAGCMDDPEHVIAQPDLVPVGERFPANAGSLVHSAPRKLLNANAGMGGRNRRGSAGMVRVTMGHEQPREASRAAVQLGLEIREVARIADARVNQDCLPA